MGSAILTNEDQARIAFAMVLAVIGAIAITKAGISPRDAMLRWVLYILVSGVVINTQEGLRQKVLIGTGIICSVAFILTIVWIAMLDGAILWLSGMEIRVLERIWFVVPVLLVVLLGNTVGIWVCAISRPTTITVLESLLAVNPDVAKKYERLIRILIAICGSIVLVLFSIL